MSEQDPQDERPQKRARLESPALPSAPIPPSTSAVDLDATSAAGNGIPEDSELAKEIRAGITVYVSPNTAGFTGVLKQRYTDFLVNEILPSGQVLHLQSVGQDVKEERPKEQKAKVSAGVAAEVDVVPSEAPNGNEEDQKTNSQVTSVDGENKAAEAPEISEADMTTVKSIFGDKVTSSILTLFRQTYKHPDRKARDFNTIRSEVISDKDDRTKAHQATRRIFLGRIETETEQDETITIKAAPPQVRNNRGGQGGRNNNSGRGGKGKVGWNELGGEYLHFTLYKENKDTMEVISYVGSQLKLHPKNFGFAGTKDRRAVTVQRVSAKRVRVEQLARLRKNLRNAEIGDFKYERNGLELGDLLGNEFTITLRDCHFPGEEGLDMPRRLELANSIVSRAVTDFKEKGFINYYGLQRFGTFASSTDQVGVKILQEDLQGAIELILQFSSKALAAAQDPNSTELISYDDKARAEALNIWKTTHDSAAALAKLPRKFNAESNIIRHLGFKDRKSGLNRLNDYQGALQQIPRNLRLMYVHAYQSLVWNVVAGKRWEMFGSNVAEGDLVLVHEHKDKDEDRVPEADIDESGEVIIRPAAKDRATDADGFERARPLSKEEAEGGKYSVFDIVLPLPGFDIEYPRNAIGEFYKEFMGSKRGGGLDPYDMRRKWKDISLSGGYRKFLSRPGRDIAFEVKEYTKDDEQMVETDLEKLRKASGKQGSVPDTTTGDSDAEMKDAEDGVKKLGVILKLQLGTSQYATIALRELMKASGVQSFKPEYSAGR